MSIFEDEREFPVGNLEEKGVWYGGVPMELANNGNKPYYDDSGEMWIALT